MILCSFDRKVAFDDILESTYALRAVTFKRKPSGVTLDF